ncbi:hypothetical protein ILP97_10410, partial [Amycolatopsis sp. H6(2020)]|nr:hypothetical protein [Amycolatopsis sp. H6(2020)]
MTDNEHSEVESVLRQADAELRRELSARTDVEAMLERVKRRAGALRGGEPAAQAAEASEAVSRRAVSAERTQAGRSAQETDVAGATGQVTARTDPEAMINALSAELKLLRKGLGIQAKTLPALVGEQLREVCGVGEDDTPGTVRGKVVETLRRLIEKLPESQRRTARIVLGFGTGANERYTQRLEL